MGELFLDMDATRQFYCYVAIGGSVIFIIQTIMTFIGAEANMDGHRNEDAFHLFSLRNIVNFSLGFGWVGVFLYNAIHNQILLAAVSSVTGIFFTVLLFHVMRALMKYKYKDKG